MTTTDWEPVSGAVLPRYAGVPSFMRLPYVPEGDPRRAEVDVGLIGMPWDGATSNRPGARHGPRGLRDASTIGSRECMARRGRRRSSPCAAPTWAMWR